MVDINGISLGNSNSFTTYSSTRVGHGKNTVVEHEFKYTINDSLLLKMTKNTTLTDSIFKLKK
jgi:hypothetical protein